MAMRKLKTTAGLLVNGSGLLILLSHLANMAEWHAG